MERRSPALFVFLVAAVLCAENEFGQEKSYYPGPSEPSIPSGPPGGPAPSSPSYGTPNPAPPDAGSSPCPSTPSEPSAPENGGSPPQGGYYGPPSAPENSGIPPQGGYYGPPSAPENGGIPPQGGYYGPPSAPENGGSPPQGGYYGTPSAPTGAGPAPPEPVVPSTPDVSTPSAPDISTPDISPPSEPDLGDPDTGSGSCSFWNDHPEALSEILSLFSTVSSLFGGGASSVFGSSVTVKQALASKRADGYGSLLREGTASLLNSLVNKSFYFSTSEVKNKFNAALVSGHSAAVQAVEFRNANEGRLHS